jgi:hypothetical protein
MPTACKLAMHKSQGFILLQNWREWLSVIDTFVNTPFSMSVETAEIGSRKLLTLNAHSDKICHSKPSPEDGNTTSSRNVMYIKYSLYKLQLQHKLGKWINRCYKPLRNRHFSEKSVTDKQNSDYYNQTYYADRLRYWQTYYSATCFKEFSSSDAFFLLKCSGCFTQQLN